MDKIELNYITCKYSLTIFFNGQNSINTSLCQEISQLLVNFGSERGSGHLD